jgi:RNA polymerase sigma-70 factor, ECF subfamily
MCSAYTRKFLKPGLTLNVSLGRALLNSCVMCVVEWLGISLKPRGTGRGMDGDNVGTNVTDDRDLARACLTGDAEALSAFVRRYQSVVFGLCYRMLGQREDAEDVVQEVFLRAFRGLAGWDQTRPIRPWLLTIAANRCRTWLVQRARRAPATDFLAGIADDDPAPGRFDLAEELQLALAELREGYRMCFILYHVHELELAEIAEIVDRPEGTIKTWLHRARKELANRLERRGIMPQVSHAVR